MFKGLFDFRNQSIVIRWRIITPILCLIFIGLLILKSTSQNVLLENFLDSRFNKQFLWFIIGVFMFMVVQYMRLQYFYDSSYLLYILLFILLFSTFFSPKINGAQSWIKFGPISFQPSEFGKIIYIICIARFFVDFQPKNKITYLFIAMLIVSIIPALMVLVQPDLGTAIIYLSVIIPMMFWSGFSRKLIFFLVSPLVSLLAVYSLKIFFIWMFIYILLLLYFRTDLFSSIANFSLNVISGLLSQYAWLHILKGHQRERILMLLDPFSDPLGSGYQLIQSIISIGSGGFWGTGWGEGSQTHLNFLPVKDTDFIISVIAEELGFITIFFILFCLAWFIYWCFDFAVRIENRYGSLLVLGLSSVIFMHIVVNMGMVSGLLPVTGLPVPFISYGGSFFVSCAIIVGLINNIVNNQI
tara:strand:+ start:4009 stop:5247 length:1239 start_codon:yes stop_codon:yes gene_type:complete